MPAVFREAMQGRQVVIFQRAKNYFQVSETEGLMSETTWKTEYYVSVLSFNRDSYRALFSREAKWKHFIAW